MEMFDFSFKQTIVKQFHSKTLPVFKMQKRKIKVLRIINRFNIGGPTYNATFLTRFLSEDFETLLVGGYPEEGEADSLHILNEYGVEPLLIEELKREPNFKSDRIAYKKLKAIIKEYKPDIVHTHAAKAGALGRKAAHSCKVPVIVHTFHGHVFHSYFGNLKSKLFQLIERNLAKKSTRIIAISDLQKIELSEKFAICNKEKIKVIPLGFDLMKFHENAEKSRIETREKYSIKNDEVAIAIIGRLAPIKDHSFFINVIKDIATKTTKKVKVFIVGNGEERANIEQQLALLTTDNQFSVVMTSWIKDIASFNPGMDIICLCSKNEGTPVSLIEAQACNVPVISTDVGGVKDIVLENETGFIVTKGAKLEYTEKLLMLIEDETLRKSMSVKGWEFVREKYHYSSLVRNIENLYLELLKEKQT